MEPIRMPDPSHIPEMAAAMKKVAEAARAVGNSLKQHTEMATPRKPRQDLDSPLGRMTHRPFADNDQFRKLGSKTINPKAQRQR